jgi:hypothetical protein
MQLHCFVPLIPSYFGILRIKLFPNLSMSLMIIFLPSQNTGKLKLIIAEQWLTLVHEFDFSIRTMHFKQVLWEMQRIDQKSKG